MRAIRLTDDYANCTKGKEYAVAYLITNKGILSYIDNLGVRATSAVGNWEILNKENTKENGKMEKWNFTVHEEKEIDFELLYDCLSYKNPMIIVKIKEKKDNCFILIHDSIVNKSYKCKKGKKLRSIIDRIFSGMIHVNQIGEVKQAVLAIKNAPYKEKFKALSCEVSLLEI